MTVDRDTTAAGRLRAYIDARKQGRDESISWDDLDAVLAELADAKRQINDLKTEWAFQYTSYGVTQTSLICDSREQAEQEAGHHRNGDRIVRRLVGEWAEPDKETTQ